MAQKYLATIHPGLEEALLEEIRELGGKRATTLRGGVEFDATHTVFYRTLQRSRIATRIWLRVDSFRARDAPELYNKTRRIDWARLLPPNATVEVRATARASRLIHTDRISRAVGDGIAASLGVTDATGPTGPTLTVLARLVDDRCELSLDASGELMYRRGWKSHAVAAPLRESVAAAMLRLCGWTPGQTLLDPFCGSGTIPIEAAQRAAGIAAGSQRTFAAQQWANFRPELWAQLQEEGAAEPVVPTAVYCSDLDPTAVNHARHNAEAAGVLDACHFSVVDVQEVEPPTEQAGWIVTNPPWNLRLADPQHAGFAALVQSFDERFAGWALAAVVPRRWSMPKGAVIAKFELGGTPVSLWVRKPS